MGLNYRKKVLLKEFSIKRCSKCDINYPLDANFCSSCGNTLSEQKTKIYGNYGKKGLTSITCKLPNGNSLNSKGTLTIPLGNGMSYTYKKP